MTKEISQLSIAIIDDDDAVREGLALILDTGDRDIAAFATGDEFLDRNPEKIPFDIIFLDLKMPGRSGLEVLRELPNPHCPVVMISGHGDVSTAVSALKLGATDFIEKPFTPEALETVIADSIQAQSTVTDTPDLDTILSSLTPREKDVALLLNEGLTNKEAAIKLDCSPRTVEIHRARVFEKLGVRNVAGLVKRLAAV